MLNGPRLEPRSGKPTHLAVFLHGYGADGNDLIGVGKEWQRVMPQVAFVAPHAPERCTMSGSGFQWFGLTMRDPQERWNGVVKARPGLDAFIDAELARTGLDESRLALIGFSQGTMMALHVGLRRPRAPAAIVGFSGALVGPERLASETTSKPPILLVHGDQDTVIPLDALFDAADALGAANIPAQWHLSMGAGHGIDQGALMHGALFLAEAFGIRLPA